MSVPVTAVCNVLQIVWTAAAAATVSWWLRTAQRHHIVIARWQIAARNTDCICLCSFSQRRVDLSISTRMHTETVYYKRYAAQIAAAIADLAENL